MSEALNNWGLFLIFLFIIMGVLLIAYFIIKDCLSFHATDKFLASEWEYANKHFVWFPNLYYSDEQIKKRKKEFEKK